MTDLWFDTPWWLPALIAGVGAVLFWTGNKRQERNVRDTGLGFIAAAMLLMGVSYFVDTPREKVIKNTHALVNAVEQRQWPAMTALIDPKCTFDKYNNRDQL